MGESATHGISGALARLGFKLERFKTGTPMRLNGHTIDVDQTQIQLGDPEPQPFSFLNDRIECGNCRAGSRSPRPRSTS